MFRQVVVLLAVSSVAMAAISRMALPEKPEKFKDVPGCYVPERDEVIPFNTSAPRPNKCESFYCSETELLIYSCGVAAGYPSGATSSDPSLTYPDCCPPFATTTPPPSDSGCDDDAEE